MRPCLSRCRHCGILFITHARNRGRKDLGCPFGCSEAYRRQRSTARSVAYYRTSAGKYKKKLQNGKRTPVRAPATPVSLTPCSPITPVTPKVAERPLRRDAPPSVTVDPRPAIPTAGAMNDTPKSPISVPVAAADVTAPQPMPAADKRLEIEEPAPHFNATIVAYVRTVVSLIEGRAVSREEIVRMLARVVRQHRMARERRMDYVVRYLNERPP